jgi:copper transport protein
VTAITPTLKNNKVTVDVILTPGRQGENTLHITVLKPNGKPFDVDELTMSITNAKRDVGPIDIPLNKLSPAHYVSEGFNIPFTGTWKITAKALLSKFDSVTLTDTIEIE